MKPHRNLKKSAFFLIIFLFSTLTGCYESKSNRDTDVKESSSIFFSIKWNDAHQSMDRFKAAADPIVCNEISSISASIYRDHSENSKLQDGGPWACENKEGSIDNIPSGYNAYVRIYAADYNGEIIYAGDSAQFYLAPNKTVNAGIIGASTFVPSGLNYTPQGIHAELIFSGVPMAWKYRIQVSESETFTDVRQYEMNATGNEIESYLLDTTSFAAGTYYFRISAIDHSGTIGKASPPTRIDIKASQPFLFRFNWQGISCETPYDITAALYNQNNFRISTFKNDLTCTPENAVIEGLVSEENISDQVRVVVLVGHNLENGEARGNFEIFFRGESTTFPIASEGSTDLGDITVSDFVPALMQPAENTLFTEIRPITFSWNPLEGAGSYDLLIYEDGEGGYYEVFRSENNTGTSVTLTTEDIRSFIGGNTSPATYRWTVRATDELDRAHQGAVLYERLRRFRFDLPDYAGVTFQWEHNQACPSGYAFSVDIYNEDTLERIHTSSLACDEKETVISDLPTGIRARTIAYVGHNPASERAPNEIIQMHKSGTITLEAGVTAQLGTLTESSFAPLPLTPADGETLDPSSPLTFTWDGVEDAGSYILSIQTSETGTLLREFQITEGLSYTLEPAEISAMVEESNARVFEFRVFAVLKYSSASRSAYETLSSHRFEFSTPPPPPEEPAGVAFQWEHNQACPSGYGFSVDVYNEDTLERVHTASLACEEKEVVISDLPAGIRARTIAYVGENPASERAPNEIVQMHRSGTVALEAGVTTQLGTLTESSFAPLPLTPADGETLDPSSPLTFTWDGVEDAGSYILSIQASETGTLLREFQITEGLSYTLEPAEISAMVEEANARVFEFRVFAVLKYSSASRSAYEILSFHRFEFSTPPPPPEEPAGVTFRWNSPWHCGGESYYRRELEIVNESTLEIVHAASLNCWNKDVTVSALPAGARVKTLIYEWTAGEDAPGSFDFRHESGIHTLESGVTTDLGTLSVTNFVPEPFSTAHGESLDPSVPLTFSWGGFEDALSYTLLIRPKASGTTVIKTFPDIQGTTYTLEPGEISAMMEETGSDSFRFKIIAVDRYHPESESRVTHGDDGIYDLHFRQDPPDPGAGGSGTFGWNHNIPCPATGNSFRIAIYDEVTGETLRSLYRPCDLKEVTITGLPTGNVEYPTDLKAVVYVTHHGAEFHRFLERHSSETFSLESGIPSELGTLSPTDFSPEPITPSDGETLDPFNPLTFSWGAVADAEEYHLSVYPYDPQTGREGVAVWDCWRSENEGLSCTIEPDEIDRMITSHGTTFVFRVSAYDKYGEDWLSSENELLYSRRFQFRTAGQ